MHQRRLASVFVLLALTVSLVSREEFEATRDYLMKNVYVMTARQDDQLGSALDSRWYGIGEFTTHMRDALGKLTVEDVNRAIARHLSADRVSIVIVTNYAAGLQQALASDAFSPIKYEGEKPTALLEEDRIAGALKRNVPANRIKVTYRLPIPFAVTGFTVPQSVPSHFPCMMRVVVRGDPIIVAVVVTFVR